MKLKLLLATLLAAATMTGCSTDPPGSATYIYKNESSYEITAKAYTLGYLKSGPVFQIGFTIVPGAEHSMFIGGDIAEIPDPFNLHTYNNYVTISNGEKQITQWESNGVLLNKKSYELVSQKGYNAIYKYVFTDKDFEVNQTSRALYEYKNESDYTITLKLYYLDNGIPVMDSLFTLNKKSRDFIPVNNDKGFLPKPFTENGTIHDLTYLTISNGEREITQHCQSTKLNLFDIESYEFVSKNITRETYRYIFTNADFDNAEPIDN